MGKKCLSCEQIKLRANFYKHPATIDKLMAICKDCHKNNVRENRARNAEYYKKFDRDRSMLPHRIMARAKYAATPAGKKACNDAKYKWSERNKEKKAASRLLNNAVRDGRIEKGCCEVCGSTIRIHGHHDDYCYPLKVRWFCPQHHADFHKMLRGH